MAKDNLSDFEKIAFVHQHRINKSQEMLTVGAERLEELKSMHQNIENSLTDRKALLNEINMLLAQPNMTELMANNANVFKLLEELQQEYSPQDVKKYEYEELEILEDNDSDSIDEFFEKSFCYAKKNNIDLNQKLTSILSHQEIQDLTKQLDEEFRYKNAQCDKYDYMIAGTIGVLGGLIDVFLVGSPEEGKVLTKWADNTADAAVRGFAKLCGWKGSREGKDPTKSAIGFLEEGFKVNYDQRHSGDVNHLFKMSPKNHHVKSLAHSPDLIGLFFSILAQFTNTSYFVDNGKIISINTKTFELQGSTVISKIYSGFINWLGHLFSDLAGSSGSKGRGSGIPIPFYNLFLLLDVGSFGQYRQTFAQACVQVFERGYDFRHGMAMSVPVVLSELLVRVMYTVKHVFYHKEQFSLSLPFSPAPELRRMLFIAHGTMCLIDVGDAAFKAAKVGVIKSPAGSIVDFLLHTNLIAWTRFGLLTWKELNAFLKQNTINEESLDSYIESEYQRILADE